MQIDIKSLMYTFINPCRVALDLKSCMAYENLDVHLHTIHPNLPLLCTESFYILYNVYIVQYEIWEGFSPIYSYIYIYN
jgi:hypothetical protein